MGMTRMGPLTFQQPVECRDCDGEGKISSEKYFFHNYISYLIGEIIAHKDKCNTCVGNKVIEENKTLEVVILPGCSNGKKIKFRGENDQLVSINKNYFENIF